jgi:hypothetical protein
MQDTVTVIVGKNLFPFAVDINLEEIGWPDRIDGKLLQLPSEELMNLRLSHAFGQEKITATVRAKRYKFEVLEPDGTFILCKDF